MSSSAIPADSSKRPVPFDDSSGEPILDDKGNPLVRPFDLPPETYVQAGLSANLLSETIQIYRQKLEQELSNPNPNGERDDALAGLATFIAVTLLPFIHGGSLDAERFDSNYVREYRHYTSIALGIFMAAAGVSREDMLWIADSYARSSSTFGPHEQMDPLYTRSAKQDIEDNRRGYELYESGRIRLKN